MDRDSRDLSRFIEAQETAFGVALAEVNRGKKTSHWMWFVFPQLRGLGRSETARYFGIADSKEAEAFVRHPVLGHRLVTITKALLKQPERDAVKIFGNIDAMKLKSSMTLFAAIENASPFFEKVLTQFFGGKQDQETLRMLGLNNL